MRDLRCVEGEKDERTEGRMVKSQMYRRDTPSVSLCNEASAILAEAGLVGSHYLVMGTLFSPHPPSYTSCRRL